MLRPLPHLSGVVDALAGRLGQPEYQPMLRWTLARVHRGMGFNNPDPNTNGEARAIREWAAALGDVRPTVVDAGANEGDFTSRVLEAQPNASVHCFEPHPLTAARLRQRFEGDPRVVVVPRGLASTEGRGELFDYQGSAGTAHASLHSSTFQRVFPSDVDSYDVHLTTLDSYARSTSISFIHYLKIDTEGTELDVLRGARSLIDQRRISVIQFEFNEHHAIAGTTLARISDALPAYRLFRLLPKGLEPLPYGRDQRLNGRDEIFQYANYVAFGIPPVEPSSCAE